MTETRSKKVSRRDFSRTSVAAGAAAVGLPSVLLGKAPAAGRSTAEAGAAAARRRRAVMPAEVSYGGRDWGGRDVRLEDTLTPARQTPPTYPGGWREGNALPAE